MGSERASENLGTDRGAPRGQCQRQVDPLSGDGLCDLLKKPSDA